MDALEAIWLGLVQGLTEFFPVSSSGHLAMFQALFGGRIAGGLLFEVAVHVATLVAIVCFYRRRIAELTSGFFRRDAATLSYVGKIALATIPTVAVGLLARERIEAQFGNPVAVALAMLVTGGLVVSTRWTAVRATSSVPSWSMAIAIGFAQALAIQPGISRSGATVAVGLACGLAPLAAAEFSFLMGIVAIAGAAVLMLPELAHVSSEALVQIAYGAAAALASGLLAIWLFVHMLDRSLFHYWAAYCWVVGGAFLIWGLRAGGV